MRPEWTGDIVKALHIHGITMKAIAAEMGVTKSYVSLILNGGAVSEKQKSRLETAVKKLIERS